MNILTERMIAASSRRRAERQASIRRYRNCATVQYALARFYPASLTQHLKLSKQAIAQVIKDVQRSTALTPDTQRKLLALLQEALRHQEQAVGPENLRYAKGNPYHDDSGQFTSKDKSASGLPKEAAKKLDRKLPIIEVGVPSSLSAKTAEAWAIAHLRGTPLKNRETKTVWYASGKSFAKMLAGNKPFARVRVAALYALERLVRSAIRTDHRADDGRDPAVKAIHQFHVPVRFDGDVYSLRLTGKEFVPSRNLENKLHSYRIDDLVIEKEPAGSISRVSRKAVPSVPSADSSISLRRLLGADNYSKGDSPYKQAAKPEGPASPAGESSDSNISPPKPEVKKKHHARQSSLLAVRAALLTR